jgi:hypothetical protein
MWVVIYKQGLRSSEARPAREDLPTLRIEVPVYVYIHTQDKTS